MTHRHINWELTIFCERQSEQFYYIKILDSYLYLFSNLQTTIIKRSWTVLFMFSLILRPRSFGESASEEEGGEIRRDRSTIPSFSYSFLRLSLLYYIINIHSHDKLVTNHDYCVTYIHLPSGGNSLPYNTSVSGHLAPPLPGSKKDPTNWRFSGYFLLKNITVLIM